MNEEKKIITKMEKMNDKEIDKIKGMLEAKEIILSIITKDNVFKSAIDADDSHVIFLANELNVGIIAKRCISLIKRTILNVQNEENNNG